MIDRWPHLRALTRAASRLPSLELWLFGSALRLAEPRDLDILAVYDDRGALVALRASDAWDWYSPPIDLIAMTRLEVVEYDFVAVTGAVRLDVPPP